MVTKHPETQAIIEDAIFKFSCIVSWAVSRLTSVLLVLEDSALASVSLDFLQVLLDTSDPIFCKSWMFLEAKGTPDPR